MSRSPVVLATLRADPTQRPKTEPNAVLNHPNYVGQKAEPKPSTTTPSAAPQPASTIHTCEAGNVEVAEVEGARLPSTRGAESAQESETEPRRARQRGAHIRNHLSPARRKPIRCAPNTKRPKKDRRTARGAHAQEGHEMNARTRHQDGALECRDRHERSAPSRPTRPRSAKDTRWPELAQHRHGTKRTTRPHETLREHTRTRRPLRTR
jgi:hypothetical protein